MSLSSPTHLYNRLTNRRGFLTWAGRSAAFAGFLAATRSLPVVAQDAPLLRIWMGEDYVPAWNAYLPVMFEKVAAEMGIRVEVELTPDNDTGRARRNTALETDTLPDIFQSGTADAAKFNDLGKVHPIVAELYARMEQADGGWNDNIKAFVTAKDGSVYGIPFYTRPWMMHYRTDLLEAAGYDALPQSIEEFKEIARAINDPGQGIFGTGMPYNQADMDGHMVSFPWLYGGSWQDEAGNLTIETAENLEAFKSYLQFFQEGLTPQDSLNWGGVGNNNAYLTGLSAMVCNTGSLFAALQRDRPDLAEVTQLGPWPKGSDKGAAATTTIGSCLEIAHNSPNAELAADFIEQVLKPENMAPLLEAGSGQAMPVRPSLADIDYFKTNQVVGQIVSTIVPTSRPLTWPGPNNAPYGDLTANSSPFFKDMLHRVLVDNMSPEDSLARFATDGQELVKKYS
tara:strand:+ start:37290 stop:38651 length:1362 start_codon:yes stop_codon:yes gene_type:complete